MQTMEASLQNFSGMVEIFAQNLENYETIQPVSFTPIIWMMVIGAVVILGAGGAVLVVTR
jgi:hypothetical protein